MIIVNAKEHKDVVQAAASLAIEDMYPSKEAVYGAIDVSQGKCTTEELIKEIKNKYVRQ